MAAVYGWVKSILFFLILMSLLETLLPSKAYGKYIRFFAGIVLILIAVRPLLDGLQLEEAIRGSFERFQFQAEAQELRREILGIEEERLQRVIADYEAEAARQVEAMAREEGFEPAGVRVVIETDEASAAYGNVVRVEMTVAPGPEMDPDGEAAAGSRALSPTGRAPDENSGEPGVSDVKGTGEYGTDVTSDAGETERVQVIVEMEPVSVKVEPVGGAERAKSAGSGAGGNASPQPLYPAALAGLRRKVASYYGLESENVEIQLEER